MMGLRSSRQWDRSEEAVRGTTIKRWTCGGSRVAWNDVKAWVAVAVLCLGCVGYPAGSSLAAQERLIEAPSLFSSSDDVERVRSSVAFDTLWVFGGPSDTLLAAPMLPRLDGAQGVVFFDMLNQAAYRLGKDGELLWTWGTKGEGPGELQAVEAIDVAPDGSIVLLDSDNLRVVRLSADGRLLEPALFMKSSFGRICGRVGGSEAQAVEEWSRFEGREGARDARAACSGGPGSAPEAR